MRWFAWMSYTAVDRRSGEYFYGYVTKVLDEASHGDLSRKDVFNDLILEASAEKPDCRLFTPMSWGVDRFELPRPPK